MSLSLLHEIARCSNVESCIQNASVQHPCRSIVSFQRNSTLDEYQIPEPWSGHIDKAPILFLSSNPSIGSDEDYPRWSWSDIAIDDYFNNRFGSGQKAWIKHGTKTLLKDGSYSKVVRFWAAVRLRAIELLERQVEPGSDYAITEIVHCKSWKEIGVIEAEKECVSKYLKKVLEIAAAKVVVVLGTRAKEAIINEFNISRGIAVSDPTQIGNKERLITFLPHPNARTVRSFTKCLKDEELQTLRSFLREKP